MPTPKLIKFKGATYRLAEQPQPEEQYTDAKHAFEESKQEFERLRKLFEYLTDKVYREELTPGEALVILTQKEGFPPEARYPERRRVGVAYPHEVGHLIARIDAFVRDEFAQGDQLAGSFRYRDLVEQFAKGLHKQYRELYPIPAQSPAAPPLPRDPWVEETSDPLTGPV